MAQPCGVHINTLLKRPGVAGAFLQTPLSLIKLMSESAFSSKSSENILKEGSPPPTCHMSNVMSHV